MQLGLAVSLVDWMKIRLNYSASTLDYAGGGTEEDEFEKSNPRATESSVMLIELSKTF